MHAILHGRVSSLCFSMERKIPVVGRQDQIERITQILGGKRRITAVDILFWHYVLYVQLFIYANISNCRQSCIPSCVLYKLIICLPKWKLAKALQVQNGCSS
jgi:hypothetical protein